MSDSTIATIEIITLPPQEAVAFEAKADASAWKVIDKTSPKYAAQLRKLFGGEDK